MTPGYLTTDIIVIIVLVVVLVLVGVCAFFTHFYWTKIGVADIWNTAKWSSMRSNVYQTIRRFSQASSKYGSERPFSAASAYSDGSDGSALPAPLRNKKSNNAANAPPPPPPPHAAASTSAPPPANAYSSVSSQNHSSDNSGRRNSRNQVQPVSAVSYNNSGAKNYGIKIGQPLESTKIHNVHEQGDRRTDGSVVIETHRF